MLFADLVECREHNRHYLRTGLFDHRQNVFVVPEVEGSFGYLNRGAFFSAIAKTEQTWKWGLETHFASCLKSGSMIFLNCSGSMMSRISSTSPKNMTSLELHVLGQNFKSASKTCGVKVESFSMNCTTQ